MSGRNGTVRERCADGSEDLAGHPDPDSRGRTQPRAPGVVNAAIAALVVLPVATIALTSRQEPPPQVAEFAPQAVESIEEELPEQSSAVGAPAEGGATPTPGATGSEDEPSDEPSPDPEPTPTASPERAAVHRCVGDPPRQTEDPQSPPCVAFWEGDNGGATWPGVTANEVRVAMPRAGFGGITDEQAQLLVGHFNRRYEFYGRTLTLQLYDPQGGAFAQPTPPDLIADAVKVDEELQAFASLAYVDRRGAEHHHYDELARRGIVSVAQRPLAVGTEQRYASMAPYQWNVQPAVDTLFRLNGDWLCRTLAGRPPAHDAGAVGGAPQRTFGAIVIRNPDGSVPPVDVLSATLDACGHPFAAIVEDDGAAPNGQNAVLQLTQAGVTTVLCLCDPVTYRDTYMNAATQQGWFPEWVATSYLNQDLDNSFHGAPTEQQASIIGATAFNKLRPRQQMPWYWAIKESDPSADPAGGIYYDAMSRYTQLLLLASGIQLAGPQLTPQTFEAGLHAASWANPGAGGAPAFQAAVGFPGRRHTWMDSGAMFWYSSTAGGTVDPAFPGAVCYVHDGARFRTGTWPTEQQPFFEDPCR